MRVGSVFRRYHRQLAIMMCIPLTLTVVSGTFYTIFDEWFSLNAMSALMLRIHSGRIFGLESIYPVLNGLGLIGLMATGLSMTTLRKKRSTATLDLSPVRSEEELTKR